MDPVIQFIDYFCHSDRTKYTLSKGRRLGTSVVAPVSNPVKLELTLNNSILSFAMTPLLGSDDGRIAFDNNDQVYFSGKGVAAFVRDLLALPETLNHHAGLIAQGTLDYFESEPRTQSRVQVAAFIRHGQFGLRQYQPAPLEPRDVVLGPATAQNLEAFKACIVRLCEDFCLAYLHVFNLLAAVPSVDTATNTQNTKSDRFLTTTAVIQSMTSFMLMVMAAVLMARPDTLTPGALRNLGVGLVVIATALIWLVHDSRKTLMEKLKDKPDANFR